MTFVPIGGVMSQALRASKIRGVQLAIVVDNKDGDGNPGYRVKLKFPWLSEKDSTFWARVAIPMAGPGRGTYVLPEIDDQVLVVFEHGDIDRPIVIGALWSKQQEPVEINQSGKNNTKLIKSRCGHRIIFDDKEGAEKITIVDRTKKNKIILDSANKLVKIESDGDIEVIAKADVILHSNALKIGTSQGVTGKAASLLAHSAKTFGFKATSSITIGGGNTTINVSNAAATRVSGSGAGELGGAAAEQAKDQVQARTGGPGVAGGSTRGGGGGNERAVSPPLSNRGMDPPHPDDSVLPTKFAIRCVDELGAPIEGLDVTFSASGNQQTVTTGGDGVARFLDPGGSSSAVADSSSLETARAVMRPRWDAIRDGELVTAATAIICELRTAASSQPPAPLIAAVELGVDVLRVVSIQPHVTRVRLLGRGFFDTSKSFILPNGLGGIRAIVEHYADDASAKVLLVGHTDTAGRSEYNDVLSLERATSLKDYLMDNVDGWLQFYGNVASEKRWGSKEDLLMLGALPDASTRPFEELPVHWFQRTRGLQVDGVTGPETRRKLVTEYMALDGTSLPGGIQPTVHGCGENFPSDPTPNDTPDAINRQAEAFFFDGGLGIQPPPRGSNSGPGAREYPEWVRRSKRTDDHEAPDTLEPVRMVPSMLFDGENILAFVERLDGQPFSDVATLEIDGVGVADFFHAPNGRVYFLPPALIDAVHVVTVNDVAHTVETPISSTVDPVLGAKALTDQLPILVEATQLRLAVNDDSLRLRYEFILFAANRRYELALRQLFARDSGPQQQDAILKLLQDAETAHGPAWDALRLATFSPQAIDVS